MRNLVVVSVLALLVGCSTSKPIGTEAPESTFTSSKTASQFLVCILPKWQIYRTKSSVNKIQGGYSLALGDSYQADDLLVIKDSSGGSVIEHYHRKSWFHFMEGGSHEEDIHACL